jgi:hypothetical protein
MEPVPMAPITMRLLGATALLPKTLEGTIVGKPMAAPAIAEVLDRNARREIAGFFGMTLSFW